MFEEVVFLSRMGTRNVGDNLCSPYPYFRQRFPRARQVEFHLGEWERYRLYLKVVLSPILVRSKMLVIGGGGLLGLKLFADDLRFWSSAPFCPKVLWGPGHNSHNVLAVDQTDPSALDYAQLKRFDKIGIRDWGVGYDWVPCASCMHPEFSQSTSESAGIVAALHYETRFSETFIHELIKTTQEPVDIVFNDDSPEIFIGKLRSAKAVVTNSYHAAYWATLLGKRVAVVGGGSKIRLLKHRPILASTDNWVQKLAGGEIYPHALEECRDRNTDFCNEVVRSYL
jgi:hypothetical protein